MKLFGLFFIWLVSEACVDVCRDSRLDIALNASGTNRSELERVLQYYSSKTQDTLKLRAAEFLIKNMPGHYTLEGELIDAYNDEFTKKSCIPYFTRKMFNLTLKSKKEILQNSSKKEDLFHIKADYLIHHIDAAFALLQECPWLRNIPFDDFLEYILPYRLECESLDFWLDSLRIREEDMDDIKYMDDIKGGVL